MLNSKPWYLSKTIWAALVGVGASVSSLVGMPIDGMSQQALVNGLSQTVAAIAGLVAIFGRLSASTKIG